MASEESQQTTTQNRQQESIQETLSRPESKDNLIDIIGVFAAIGVGTGLIGLIGAGQVGIAGQIFSAIALIVVMFSGPIVAAYFGLRLSDGMKSDNRAVLLTSAVGTGAGYVVMLLLAGILSGALGQGVSFGDFILAAIMFGVVTGLVGAASTYISLRDNDIVG